MTRNKTLSISSYIVPLTNTNYLNKDKPKLSKIEDKRERKEETHRVELIESLLPSTSSTMSAKLHG